MMPPTSAPRVVHVADGNAVEFNFDFAIFQSGDLEVFLDASLQADGFTIGGGYPSDGGTVVFQQAPAAGTVVTLQRRLSIERTTDFQPSGALIANTLNEEFDRLVAMLQQVDEDASRAVRASPTETDANLLLPAREARAGRILGFDESGDLTTLTASLPDLPNLDAIPEGADNKHFTLSEKAKLATVEPQSEANPPQVTAEEKDNGSELSLRSFAPRDVADMARKHAPSGAVSSVFGRTAAVGAQTGDYTAAQITDTANKVMMTSTERAKLAGFTTVTEFGAVGDGVTDDTAAFVAAAAYAVQNKKALRVPAGTYLLKQRISFANAPVALVGDGIGLSILKWAADATSLGISITSNSDTQFHLIRDLSFYVAKKGGTAVTFDYTGQVDSVSFAGKKLTMDRSSPRFLAENVFFRGSADVWTTGWDVGIDAVAALKSNIINCSFTGWLSGSNPQAPGSARAYRFRGINTTYENGHPCEFLVAFSSVYYAQTGIEFNGCEGGLVNNCQLVGVNVGVLFDDTWGRPQLSVSNTHINCYAVGIWAKNCAQAALTGNLIYAVIDAKSVVTGVILDGTIQDGSSFFAILGNNFQDTSITGNKLNAIIVNKGSYGIIDANVFRSAVTAIWLTASSSYCKVGASNTYAAAPAVATRVINQGTNNTVAP